MAGIKYTCTDCGLAAWFARKPATCVECGSANIDRTKIVELPIMKCETCGDEFKPKRPNQVTCCVSCRDARRKAIDYAADAARNGKKPLGSAHCKACGVMFRKKVHNQEHCTSSSCQNKRMVGNNKAKRLRDVHRSDLGPSEPLNPMRKCHESHCKEMTYDYRCERCLEKFRSRGNASGLSSMGQLFSGRYIPQGGGSRIVYG